MVLSRCEPVAYWRGDDGGPQPAPIGTIPPKPRF